MIRDSKGRFMRRPPAALPVAQLESRERLVFSLLLAGTRASVERSTVYLGDDFRMATSLPAEGSYLRVAPDGALTLHRSRKDRGKPAGNVKDFLGRVLPPEGP